MTRVHGLKLPAVEFVVESAGRYSSYLGGGKAVSMSENRSIPVSMFLVTCIAISVLAIAC